MTRFASGLSIRQFADEVGRSAAFAWRRVCPFTLDFASFACLWLGALRLHDGMLGGHTLQAWAYGRFLYLFNGGELTLEAGRVAPLLPGATRWMAWCWGEPVLTALVMRTRGSRAIQGRGRG